MEDNSWGGAKLDSEAFGRAGFYRSHAEVDDLIAQAKTKFTRATEAFQAGHFSAAQILSGNSWQHLQQAHSAARSQRKVKVSIVVVTYRYNEDFIKAIRIIWKQASRFDAEVILVDNGNEYAEDVARSTSEEIIFVRSGFNYGCSGGRNLGAFLASGEYVLFLDDDGFIQPQTIGALLESIEENSAVAVRGKVVPKTDGGITGSHYDLGDAVVPSLITAEGVSIWRRSHFQLGGGFDVLLSGHEGVLLCLHLFRFVGPAAFLYEPNAVLEHDFSANPDAEAAKRELHQRNKAYLEFCFPQIERVLKTIRSVDAGPRAIYGFATRGDYRELTAPAVTTTVDPGEPMSIITTARNVAPFVADYTRGLMGQTYSNFEVVFVDDGSTDSTVEDIESLWRGDSRLRLIKTEGAGRGAALNIAVEAASHDLCCILDADDVPITYRLAATASLLGDKDIDALCGYSFHEESAYLIGRPHSPFAVDFQVRALFGMPASFPTFAFRRHRFQEKFSEDLRGGVDYDWLYRNMKEHGVRGRVFPLNFTYYRIHEGQISVKHRDAQRAVAERWIPDAHAAWLGAESLDEQLALMLSGWNPVTTGDAGSLKKYSRRLIEAAPKQLREAVAHALFERVDEVMKTSGKPAPSKAPPAAPAAVPAAAPAPAKIEVQKPSAPAVAASAKPSQDPNVAKAAVPASPPRRFRDVYEKGRELYAADDYVHAKDEFEAALNLKPSSKLAMVALAEIAVASGDLPAALERFDRLCADYDTDDALRRRRDALKGGKIARRAKLAPLLVK